LIETKKQLADKQKERRKNKGPREKMLFDILIDDLKIQFQPLYGELSMTGNHCWKFINNYERIVPCFDGVQGWDRLKELFSRFQIVAEGLYRISPSLGFTAIQEELDLEREEARLEKEKLEQNAMATANGEVNVVENENGRDKLSENVGSENVGSVLKMLVLKMLVLKMGTQTKST